ncbi:MAG: hypothetical protein KY475_03195, partial [Planctomycetes bacterium]|nr:hypothetical protein [Planctomycetota bacterium]
TIGLYDRGDQLLAEHERAVWLFSRDPFVNRREWLKDLKIALYDPEGATQKVFDEAEIPYNAPRTTAALGEVEDGVAIIGEGVSFGSRRGLAETLANLAARGVPVICLAPADGEIPFPGGEEQPLAESVELRRSDVIKEFDKRLDADHWPPAGQVVKSGLTVAGRRGGVTLEVGDSPIAWPWLRASYAGGKQEIICGFGVIEAWDAAPTPRFLLAEILKQLTDEETKTDPLNPSEEN